MKALYYISGLLLLTLGSCSSNLYVGTEYDDLYYLSSDEPVTRVETRTARVIQEGNLRSDEYYDNIYATDTLVSDDFRNAVDYEDELVYGNDRLRAYDYYDYYSYSGRLNRFYGNYFYPYWRDPFYYSMWSYPVFSYSFGLGGYPYYYYDPFYYDYYYSPFYYGSYYGGYYGRYYSPYYSYWHSPFYRGYYPYYYGEASAVNYGRSERVSSLSSRWLGGSSSATGSLSRRDAYSSGSGSVPAPKSSGTQVPVAGSRRSSQEGNTQQELVKSGTGTNTVSQSRRPATAQPEYNSVNRSYTPSYSNPRMSTRPSYNNSRVNPDVNRSSNTVINRSAVPSQRSYQSQPDSRTRSSYSTAPSRSSSSYSNTRSYSVPSRRSYEGTRSSGSYGSSGSRSSYGGSSGSVSRSSSYSSGGSSSSSSYSSGSSSSRSSSSGRR